MKSLRFFTLYIFAIALIGLSFWQTACLSQPVTLNVMLKQSWQFYKNRFMENGEHVISETFGGTISEGQSYAMLKAVWMNDPQTFEKAWQWTKTHLARPNDHLFAWQWGELQGGAKGIKDMNQATDADQDIAYALLVAGEQWNRPDYISAAQSIIEDLWRIDVTYHMGRYYLVPGSWNEFRKDYLTLDPSYMAPYVYRKFAQYDKTHAQGWQQLAQDIYPTLEACSALTANKLPPNWCAVNYETGQIIFSDKQGEQSRDFGYDAFRVFWRMSMDSALGSAEARSYLTRHTALLDYWRKYQTLPEGFGPGGNPLGKELSGFALSAAAAQANNLRLNTETAQLKKAVENAYHQEGYWFNDYNDFLHSVIWLHLYTATLP